VQSAKEKRISGPNDILTKFTSHRFARVCALLIKQGLKDSDLAETQLTEIGGLGDLNAFSKSVKAFVGPTLFSEHASADPVPP
jgi:hypothetical protein